MKKTKWIPLAEFARRIRVHRKVAYRLALSGRVRSRSERRGKLRAWYVAEREVKAVLANPPWLDRHNGGVPPKRGRFANAKVRVNNLAWLAARRLRRLP